VVFWQNRKLLANVLISIRQTFLRSVKKMAQPFDITDDLFESDVINSDVPVLVDFWATWCGPCRMIAPHLKQIAAEHSEDVLKVAKLDVDDNPMTPGMYGVVGIPTLMLFKGGEVVERITGALPKNAIEAKIMPHLNVTPA
jgi:thioredoxin 1